MIRIAAAALAFALAACTLPEATKVGATGAAGASAGAGGSGGITAGAGGSGGVVSGGVGGTGGLGGAGDDCGATSGSPMVKMSSYCIDATEVTNGDYSAFLIANVDTTSQPPKCSWNTSFTPVGWPVSPSEFSLPVRYVDWCDALAYCSFVGKRLCGSPSKGPADYSDFDNQYKSAWFDACTATGKNIYPWGSSWDATKCNGKEYGAGAPVAVGSLPGCVGSHPGLYDMEGNVTEWEDACDDDTGMNDNCRLRGASYLSGDITSLKCDWAFHTLRYAALPEVGFRCCSA